MPSYTSRLFPQGTDVIVHFSHGHFQTIVLENSGGEYYPVACAEETILLSDALVTLSSMNVNDAVGEDYRTPLNLSLPIITAKVSSNTTAPQRTSDWRSSSLDALIRGERASSVLLECMPSVAANTSLTAAPQRTRGQRRTGPIGTAVAPVNVTLLESDWLLRWLSNSGMTQINAATGRIMRTALSTIPTELTILREHPQYLITRGNA